MNKGKLHKADDLLNERYGKVGTKSRKIFDNDCARVILGNKIAVSRHQLGISQNRLAEMADIGASTVSRIEVGDDVKLSSLVKVLHELGMNISLERDC
ncbi:helix-turn-helix domain-containing protein [Carboxylicivirga sp. N1Y90]|uniref:helix-turn-helix domain-containing protein n=1 Tax=Carboxylicivirga fragile TaxID=3417571 RepID=UPI003D32957A|nr:helix-turn-helix transcriptional regulator [Marinilabiliaceae bacterium N1Y90]